MAVTNIQSNLVPVKLSSDAGVTYKDITCKKGWTFNLSTSTTKEETDCGVLLGIGANEWSVDFEGILNSTPGASEFSAEDVLGFVAGQTALKIKIAYPTSGGSPGSDLYAQGDGYITNFKITNSVGSLMQFSGTFSGTGTLDVTP